MKSILSEILNLRKNSSCNIDHNNSNRYRIVFIEDDGTKTAYYFSCPIYNNKSKKIVDFNLRLSNDGICAVGSSSYITLTDIIKLENSEGLCIIYPSNKLTYYNSKEVKYGSDIVHPTINGIVYKAAIDEAHSTSFFVEINNSFQGPRATNKSFSIMSEQFRPFVTFSCIGITDDDGNVIAPARLNYEKIDDKKYKVTFDSLNVSGKWILFEVNLYEQKLFQDTTVESNNPNDNNAFGSIGYIGNSKLFGEQWLYSRLNYKYFSELKDKSINKAIMYIPQHNKNSGKLCAFSIPTRFCSFGSTWNNRIAGDSLINDSTYINNYQRIDIISLFFEIKVNLTSPSNGLILKSKVKGSGFSVISTGDSSYAPQILEVNYD